jgi:hypothetical protein
MNNNIIILILVFANLFQSCNSEANDAANADSKDSLSNGIDNMPPPPITTYPALKQSIDSAAKKDGNALVFFQTHSLFVSTLTPEQMDTLYYLLVDEMNAYLDNDLPYIPENQLDKNYQVKKSYEAELVAKGIHVQTDGEGGYFPIVDQKKVFAVFNGHVTAPLQEFITFFNENDEYIAFDAGLVKTPQEIATRILFYDWHIKNNPKFPRNEILLGMYAQEMYFVMFGLDNTPAFSYEDNIIFEEHKIAFDILLEKGSPFTKKIIGAYVDALKKVDWHYMDNSFDKYYFGIEVLRKKEMK